MADYSTKTDEQCIALAQGGDKDAEEELLIRYRHLVLFFARKFFLIGGETEDLIQEGMIGLYQAVGEYDGGKGKSFRNFARLCIAHKIIDAVKKADSKKNAPLKNYVSIFSEEDLSLDAPDPEEKMIYDDDRRELNKRMSRILTDVEFKVFTMYMDGASSAEICETTGKSPKSIDNAIQRSKQKLRKALKDKDEK